MSGRSTTRSDLAGSRYDNFFCRRKGRPLGASQDAILSARLPVLRIDTETAPPDDLRQLFPVAVDTVQLEIGF
ncbi:MAG: tRNA (guanosine(46)-N7)-methyltransferase TrmB, partial [Alphaproteobacteria bacterium]